MLGRALIASDAILTSRDPSSACWWDYGQLKLYTANNLKLNEEGSDADLLRRFFGVTARQMNSEVGGVAVDDSACVFSCRAKSGSVGANVSMAAVEVQEVQIGEGAIVVNCCAKKIVALLDAEGVGRSRLTYTSSDARSGVTVTAPEPSPR